MPTKYERFAVNEITRLCNENETIIKRLEALEKTTKKQDEKIDDAIEEIEMRLNDLEGSLCCL